jgi:hypothetical protein
MSFAWLVSSALIIFLATVTDDDAETAAQVCAGGAACGARGGRPAAALRAPAPNAPERCTLRLGNAWGPDASAATAAKCAAEQATLISSKGVGADERAFVRTIDWLFSREGRRASGMEDSAHAVRLVTACATYDSLWDRYPSLGRTYNPRDRVVVVDGHPETAAHLTRRGKGDVRVQVFSAMPWDVDLPTVTVRWVRESNVHQPVRVDPAMAGAWINWTDGGNVPGVRLDTLLPPSPVGDSAADGVDVLLIGNAGGDEARVLAGAPLLLSRARFAFMQVHAKGWDGAAWDAVVNTFEDAGMTVVLAGNPRHILLSGPVRPPLAEIPETAVVMGVATKERAGRPPASSAADFLRDYILAGRRGVTIAAGHGATDEGQSSGLAGSSCTAWAEAQVSRGCPGGKVDVPKA